MKDLKKVAIAALDFNKHFSEVFVSTDGVPFQFKNDAVNYAMKLDDKTIEKFERDSESSTHVEPNKDKVEKTYTLNGTDTIKLITQAMSEEAVNTILADDERKTVITSAQKRIAELKTLAIAQQAANADKALQERQNDNANEA